MGSRWSKRASWARESGRERRQISSNSTAGHYEKGGSNVDKKRGAGGGGVGMEPSIEHLAVQQKYYYILLSIRSDIREQWRKKRVEH